MQKPDINGFDFEEIQGRFESFTNIHDIRASIVEENSEAILRFYGKSAHAMEPDNGVNAAVLLATFLNKIFVEGESKDFTQFIFDAFGTETRGRFLGLAFNDEISGDTTLNAGMVSFTPEQGGRVDVSMRYSVTYPFEEKVGTCIDRLERYAIRNGSKIQFEAASCRC